MNLLLSVTDGPHTGREFVFAGRDSFLVGRTKDAHFRFSYDDPYFSRRHFLLELNPPRCRLLDLKSRNGVSVNGAKVDICELSDGDMVKAGHTVFRVTVVSPKLDSGPASDLPSAPESDDPAPTSQADIIAARPEETVRSRGNLIPGAPSIPGYQLDGVLGRGGMGIVYRAMRTADQTPAAVKVIIPAAGAGGKQVERFLREARILGELRHRNIVRFLEAGEGDAGLFIAMELIEGSDVTGLVTDRGPLPIKTAVGLVCQALAGLCHAHAAGYVHRDVKPSNLLLGRSGRKRVVKLADFGLARAFEVSKLSGLTLNGDVGGTPAFMPPEQVTHYRDVTPAADQYAAAATLYYLLTATYAFNFGPVVATRLVQILTEDPIPVRDRRPEIPAELAGVIHRALSRDPADRYPSTTAFQAALLPFA